MLSCDCSTGPGGPPPGVNPLALLRRRLPSGALLLGRLLRRPLLRRPLLRSRLLRRPLLRGRLLRRPLLRSRLLGCALLRRPLLYGLSGPRSCLLDWTHIAAFRQRFLVGAAFEGLVVLDDALLAGAAFLAAPLFRNSFHVELAENLTAFEAGILTATPVRGLRPVRARRCVAENEPSWGSVTLSPDFTAERSVPTNASSTRSASRLTTSASLATRSTSSDLFKCCLL